MSTSSTIPRTCYPSLHSVLQRSISHSNVRLAVLTTRCLHTRSYSQPPQRPTNNRRQAHAILEGYSSPSLRYRLVAGRESSRCVGDKFAPGVRPLSTRTKPIRRVNDEIQPAKYYTPYVEESPGLFGDDLFRPSKTYVDKSLTWERDQLLDNLKRDPELVKDVGVFLTTRFPNITEGHVYTLLSHLADEDHRFLRACLTEILFELEVWPSLREQYSKDMPEGCKLRYFPGSDIVDIKWDQLSDGLIGYIHPQTGKLHILAIVEAKLGAYNGWISLFRGPIPHGRLLEKIPDLAKELHQSSAAGQLSISLADFTKKLAQRAPMGGQFLKDLIRLYRDQEIYIQGENKVDGKERPVPIKLDPRTVHFLAVLPCMVDKATQGRFVKEESETGYIALYRKHMSLRHVYPHFVTPTFEDLELISTQVLNIVRKRVMSGKILKEYFNYHTLEAIMNSERDLAYMIRQRASVGSHDVRRTDQSHAQNTLNVPLYDKRKLSKVLIQQFLENPPRYETFLFQFGTISGTFTGNDAPKFAFASTYPCLSNGNALNSDGKSVPTKGVIDMGSVPRELWNVIRIEEEKLMAREEKAWKEAGGRWAIAGLHYVPDKEFTFSLMRRDPPRKYEPGTSLADLLHDAVIERQSTPPKATMEQSKSTPSPKPVEAVKSDSTTRLSSEKQYAPPSAPKPFSPPKVPPPPKPVEAVKSDSAARLSSEKQYAPPSAPKPYSPPKVPPPPKAAPVTKPVGIAGSSTLSESHTPPSAPKATEATSTNSNIIRTPISQTEQSSKSSTSPSGEELSRSAIHKVEATQPGATSRPEAAVQLPAHRRAFVKTEQAIQQASKYANVPSKENAVEKAKRLEREKRQRKREEVEARAEAQRLEEEEQKRRKEEERRKELEEKRAKEAEERAQKMKMVVDFHKTSFPNPTLPIDRK